MEVRALVVRAPFQKVVLAGKCLPILWLNLFDLGRFWEFLADLVIVFLSVDKISVVCNWSCYCLVFLEALDRSVASVNRIRLQLGTLSFCGGYQEVPFPKASVPFCGAGVFQCLGCCLFCVSVFCVCFCLWCWFWMCKSK